MSCYVPDEFKHLRWHIIKDLLGNEERAEWVNDERNGPTEKGHWVRWGKTGDFPSLCQATYLWPSADQDSEA